DVAGLAADPGQGDEVRQLVRHLTAEALHEAVRHPDEAAGLRPEEPGGADHLLDVGGIGGREVLRRGVLGEERRGHHVHPLVGALRRQDRGDEQLVGVGMAQRAQLLGGARVLVRQPLGSDSGAALGATGSTGGHQRGPYRPPDLTGPARRQHTEWPECYTESMRPVEPVRGEPQEGPGTRPPARARPARRTALRAIVLALAALAGSCSPGGAGRGESPGEARSATTTAQATTTTTPPASFTLVATGDVLLHSPLWDQAAADAAAAGREGFDFRPLIADVEPLV